MFSDPVKNVEQCGLLPGIDVADLGAGSGFYSIAAAKALISSGKVYSIDIQKLLLTKLKNNAAKEGLYNIEVIWGDIEKVGGTNLGDSSIDFAFLCNILFQLEDKKTVMKEIKRILKPGGRVLIVDWADSFGGMGPAPTAVVKKETVLDNLQKEGFHLEKEISAGSHHFGLIFKKL